MSEERRPPMVREEMIEAGEAELAEVLSAYHYVMPEDGMRRVLTAALSRQEPVAYLWTAVGDGTPYLRMSRDHPGHGGDVLSVMALVPASPVQQGWRPMDSAPKDGTFVDLWARRGSFYEDRWERYPDMWFASGLNAWRNGKGNIQIKPEFVTHWMPRPAAPVTAKHGGSNAAE